ncbi:MAG: choice-of-anchor tandem repeat GloVer-containing protein [Terriglobales bacterium]
MEDAKVGKSGKRSRSGVAAAAIFVVLLTVSASAFSQTENVLFDFDRSGDSGWWPNPMIFDAAGNLYGTNTMGGGSKACTFGCGSAFELSPDGNGGYNYTVLYDFQGGADGEDPSPVVLGADGSLYGVTVYGGAPNSCAGGCGTVFKLTPPGGSGNWTKSTLYTFAGGNDGGNPFSGLALDSAGNIYGTTFSGGTGQFGTFFELSPQKNGKYSKQILYEFQPGIAGSPVFLLQESGGNFYGTTQSQGIRFDPGVVFQLTKNESGQWQETVLHEFTGTSPGALVMSPSGSLFGATDATAKCMVCGSIYELTPTGGKWQYSPVASFDGGRKGATVSGLAVDAAGNVYGTAYESGPLGYGFVCKLTLTDGKWTETILHNFDEDNGVDGGYPAGGIVLDNAGNIFGATYYGGNESIGLLYEISQ